VVLLSCGDLLLLGAIVRVDGVFEAHEREQNESLPLVSLESSDQVRNYSFSPAKFPARRTNQYPLSKGSQRQQRAQSGDHMQ